MQVAADQVTSAAEAMTEPGGEATFKLVQDHPFQSSAPGYPALAITRRDPRFEKLDRRGERYLASMGLRVAILVHADLDEGEARQEAGRKKWGRHHSYAGEEGGEAGSGETEGEEPEGVRRYDDEALEALWGRLLEEMLRQGHPFNLRRAPQYEISFDGYKLRIAVLHLDFEADFHLDP